MNTISHHNERFAENIQEKRKKKKQYAETRVLFIYLFKSRIENLHLEVGPYAASFALFYLFIYFLFIFSW